MVRCHSQEWKEALWDKCVPGTPRPRTRSELQYSDRKLRSCSYPFLSRELTATRHRHHMPPLRASPTSARFSCLGGARVEPRWNTLLSTVFQNTVVKSCVRVTVGQALCSTYCGQHIDSEHCVRHSFLAHPAPVQRTQKLCDECVQDTILCFKGQNWEICAEVGDARSGGGLNVAEPVAELNPLDNLG